VTAIDDPSRFKWSRDVAAHFGLTSRRWQSGSSIDVQGRISKAGDGDVRRALYEAASALLTRFKRKDKVKTWGLAIAKRTSHRKATRCGGAQACGDHACDVGRWHVLLRRSGRIKSGRQRALQPKSASCSGLTQDQNSGFAHPMTR
jgi:hypothetical protein